MKVYLVSLCTGCENSGLNSAHEQWYRQVINQGGVPAGSKYTKDANNAAASIGIMGFVPVPLARSLSE